MSRVDPSDRSTQPDVLIVEHYPTDAEWRRRKWLMAGLVVVGLIYLVYWLIAS